MFDDLFGAFDVFKVQTSPVHKPDYDFHIDPDAIKSPVSSSVVERQELNAEHFADFLGDVKKRPAKLKRRVVELRPFSSFESIEKTVKHLKELVGQNNCM